MYILTLVDENPEICHLYNFYVDIKSIPLTQRWAVFGYFCTTTQERLCFLK